MNPATGIPSVYVAQTFNFVVDPILYTEIVELEFYLNLATKLASNRQSAVFNVLRQNTADESAT